MLSKTSCKAADKKCLHQFVLVSGVLAKPQVLTGEIIDHGTEYFLFHLWVIPFIQHTARVPETSPQSPKRRFSSAGEKRRVFLLCKQNSLSSDMLDCIFHDKLNQKQHSLLNSLALSMTATQKVRSECVTRGKITPVVLKYFSYVKSQAGAESEI